MVSPFFSISTKALGLLLAAWPRVLMLCMRKARAKRFCSVELAEHLFGRRLGIDRRLQVVGDLQVLAAAIGAVPAAIGLGGLDVLEPMPGHQPRLLQPGDIVDVDLAPHALLAARRVALQEALVVVALADWRRSSPSTAPHRSPAWR